MNCRNCNQEVQSNFCSNCGQPVTVRRIDRHYIGHEIQHLLHVERGLFYTIRELVIRPGQTIRDFIAGNRIRIVKPVYFIIVTSLIYSLCNYFFHFEDGYVKYMDTQEDTTKEIFKWIQSNYGYANIIMGVFIAMCLKLFFRKYPYNFFEILILLCYVMGVGMLIYTVFGIVQGLTDISLMEYSGVVGFIYTAWSIGQFYGKGKFRFYILAIIAYLLGMLLFSLTAILGGTIFDMLVKQ